MATYGTKEYWEDIRDQSALVLDSLMATGFSTDVPYRMVDNFCKVFRDNYDEYCNAIERIRELEATNVDNCDA